MPRDNLHHEVIKEFEIANGIYDHSQPFRCTICDLPCKTKTGVKIHAAKMHGKANDYNDKEKTQSFANTLADKAVKSKKLSKQQKLRPTVMCEKSKLKNIFDTPTSVLCMRRTATNNVTSKSASTRSSYVVGSCNNCLTHPIFLWGSNCVCVSPPSFLF